MLYLKVIHDLLYHSAIQASMLEFLNVSQFVQIVIILSNNKPARNIINKNGIFF